MRFAGTLLIQPWDLSLAINVSSERGHMASAHVQRPAKHAPAAGRKTCAYMRPESVPLYVALLVDAIEGRAAKDFSKTRKRSAPLGGAGRF